MLEELTGAGSVFMLGRRQEALRRIGRRRAGAAEEREAGAVPARRQHRRLGRRSSRSILDMFVADVDLGGLPTLGDVQRVARRSRRHRRTSRWPCATRSRSAPTDEVTVTAITAELGSGDIVHDTVELRAQPRAPLVLLPRHDDRRGDRVQVRRQRSNSGAVRVAHTAFTDPTCPPGVPTRASVEMRAPRAVRLMAAPRRSTRSSSARRALTEVTDVAPEHFLENLDCARRRVNDEAALTDEGIQGILEPVGARAAQPHRGRRLRRRAPRGRRRRRCRRRSSSPGCPARAPRTSSTSSTRTRGCGCCARGRGSGRRRPPALDPDSAAQRHAASVENAPAHAGGDRRQDRRLPPHRRRRPAGVPGHPRPDVREPRDALDDVGVRLPRVPAPRGRPAGGVRVPRPCAAAAAAGCARAALGA